MSHPTARSLAQALAAGRVDPVDLVAQLFERIAACEDRAVFVDLLPDRARAEAEAARARLAAGRPAGPLDGVPIAWKDLFDLAGRATTAGSVVLRDAPPAAADAAVVAAGRKAGLVAVGTTNMTEFAYSGIGLNPHYGTPRNPHGAGPARVPGGSSSGSAVAVARGLVPIAFGTDTGGSVRIPASFNGIVGYKASTGRYAMDGVFPLSRTFDSLGPLAQDVADCALLDAVLRGRADAAIAPAPPGGLDLLVPETLVFEQCEPAVREAFEATVDRLGRAGARIRRAPLSELAAIPELVAQRGHRQLAEALALHWDRVHGPEADRMDARVVGRLRQGARLSAVDLVLFDEARQRMIADATARIGGAFVIFPTTATVAMAAEPLERDPELFFARNALTLRNTMVGNFLDWCGVSIPNGRDADGMPTGFLISAPHGRDAALLGAALAIEEIVRG